MERGKSGCPNFLEEILAKNLIMIIRKYFLDKDKG